MGALEGAAQAAPTPKPRKPKKKSGVVYWKK
jgi:hypothetical protein